MNKDQVKGRVKETTGTLQKKGGRTAEDERHEISGANTETEGKIQKKFGDVKNKIGKAIDK